MFEIYYQSKLVISVFQQMRSYTKKINIHNKSNKTIFTLLVYISGKETLGKTNLLWNNDGNTCLTIYKSEINEISYIRRGKTVIVLSVNGDDIIHISDANLQINIGWRESWISRFITDELYSELRELRL